MPETIMIIVNDPGITSVVSLRTKLTVPCPHEAAPALGAATESAGRRPSSSTNAGRNDSSVNRFRARPSLATESRCHDRAIDGLSQNSRNRCTSASTSKLQCSPSLAHSASSLCGTLAPACVRELLCLYGYLCCGERKISGYTSASGTSG